MTIVMPMPSDLLSLLSLFVDATLPYSLQFSQLPSLSAHYTHELGL